MIEVTKNVCFGYYDNNVAIPGQMFHCSILGLQEQDGSAVEK
jgi:hypothetical protein